MEAERTYRWVVSGRVQGVGFRWYTLRRAQELQVGGWVSNLVDGRVEVVARGAADHLDSLERALRAGPAGANVETVEKSDIPPEMVSPKTFEIR
jgi:acylphosphatase